MVTSGCLFSSISRLLQYCKIKSYRYQINKSKIVLITEVIVTAVIGLVWLFKINWLAITWFLFVWSEGRSPHWSTNLRKWLTWGLQPHIYSHIIKELWEGCREKLPLWHHSEKWLLILFLSICHHAVCSQQSSRLCCFAALSWPFSRLGRCLLRNRRKIPSAGL